MSSVGVVTQKNLCVLWEKKSKCPKKNFQSVERGKKCKCRISGVRKKGNWKKSSGKKIKVFFGWEFKVKDFAKFVFTSWALC